MTQLELIVYEGCRMPDACGQPSQSLRPSEFRGWILFIVFLPVLGFVARAQERS